MTTTPSLPKKKLGNSDLEITSVGFGAWAIGGGDWEFSWGAQDDQDSIDAILRALDLGVNWIDTASVYGLGHSEEIVGKAFRNYGGPEPYLFTKNSMRWDSKNRKIYRSLKKHSLREELEASLRRLGVDVIDLLQIHWPDPEAEIEEGWAAMAGFVKEGKVRYIGVSNFNIVQMERIRQIHPITSLQPPYNLINRTVEAEILPYCERNNIGVICYSPMNSGLLTGAMTPERVANLPEDDWRRRNQNFQSPKLEKNLALVELLRKIGNAHGRAPGEVAIAWTLRKPAVTAAIVGARSPQQVDGVIGAATFRLTAEEIREIDEFVSANEIGRA
jgi:aryl-alcohol dehydrogenase-like predicted oxidoreductase